MLSRCCDEDAVSVEQAVLCGVNFGQERAGCSDEGVGGVQGTSYGRYLMLCGSFATVTQLSCNIRGATLQLNAFDPILNVMLHQPASTGMQNRGSLRMNAYDFFAAIDAAVKAIVSFVHVFASWNMFTKFSPWRTSFS